MGADGQSERTASGRRTLVRVIRRLLLAVAILAVATSVYVGVTLPPHATSVSAALPSTIAVGGYHIHSKRSDGSGDVDAIAEAAARAELRYIILTDHGDATRAPDPPQYRHGVLCIDAVEIGTTDGHLVALGLAKPSPYPLAGEGRDVLEDVHRLGGFAILAHPDSPRDNLKWRAWSIPYDGIEWLNMDSEWRAERTYKLIGDALRYFIRPAETMAGLFSRPTTTLRRWDSTTRLRPIVALGALDAHAGWNTGEEPRRSSRVSIPSYVQMFRTLNQAAILDQPLTGNAASDAGLVLEAITRGHTYSIVRGIADAAALDFTATMGQRTLQMGDQIPWVGAPIRLQASVPNVPGAVLTILRDGVALGSFPGRASFDISAGGRPGLESYRVEVTYGGNRRVPWLVSNPIYVSTPLVPDSSTAPGSGARDHPQLVELPADPGWTIEKEKESTAQVLDDIHAPRFIYALGGGQPAGQFAALVSSVDTTKGFDRVLFTARADHPMRLWVQLRLPNGKDGERWGRSVYVDQTPRPIVVPLSEFEPMGRTTSFRPNVAHIRQVLFVVDTVNTPPGSRGTIWFADIALSVGAIVPAGGGG